MLDETRLMSLLPHGKGRRILSGHHFHADVDDILLTGKQTDKATHCELVGNGALCLVIKLRRKKEYCLFRILLRNKMEWELQLKN
ncbi:TPA: hypothetical protein ACS72K_003736 [Providencia alcalifaciens]